MSQNMICNKSNIGDISQKCNATKLILDICQNIQYVTKLILDICHKSNIGDITKHDMS